jgi:hypothetical protein
MRGDGVEGSPVAPPRIEHELSHAEAEPRARRHRPWGRGHRAEVGTAGSPTLPYMVGACVVAEATLPTTSTDPARVMALPSASRRILSGSRHQEGDPDCSSAGVAEWAAEGCGTARVGKQEAQR